MIALSEITQLNCQFYLKTSTKSHKRIVHINAVAQWVNHNINKTDCDKYTFLQALLAFHRFTGCDSTRSFAGESKSKSLSLLSSNENYIYGFNQVGTFRTVNSLTKLHLWSLWKKITDTNLPVNEVSYNINCQKNGIISFAMLPPRLNVSKQFIIRIYYQMLIWRKCSDNFMVLNQPWKYGWCINKEKLGKVNDI